MLDATDELARDYAIDVLTTIFRLHGLAIERVLGLPDGSITTLACAQVDTRSWRYRETIDGEPDQDLADLRCRAGRCVQRCRGQ